MRTVLFNGPFIPEIDAAYNVQANGVSINFLKNPFCFKAGFLSSINDLNNTSDRVDSLSELGKHMKVLKPLRATKYVEVPKYLYEERLVEKLEVVNKNVYVPYDGPVFRTKEVKVPVYKEKIKYVPVHVEREKLYAIPKLKIHDLIQENLLYLHKNKIQYKDLDHVVERVIPTLNTKVVEKTVSPQIIEIAGMSQSTNVSEQYPSSSVSYIINEHTEPELLDNEDNNNKYADILLHEYEHPILEKIEKVSPDSSKQDMVLEKEVTNTHEKNEQENTIVEEEVTNTHEKNEQENMIVEKEVTNTHEKNEQENMIVEKEVTNTHEKNEQDNNSVIYPMEYKEKQKYLTEEMDKIEAKSDEKENETEGNTKMSKFAALPSLNLSTLIIKKESKDIDANLLNEDCLELSEVCSLSKKSSTDSFDKLMCSREHSYDSCGNFKSM